MKKIKSIISLVLALILACAVALPISAAGAPAGGGSVFRDSRGRATVCI